MGPMVPWAHGAHGGGPTLRPHSPRPHDNTVFLDFWGSGWFLIYFKCLPTSYQPIYFLRVMGKCLICTYVTVHFTTVWEGGQQRNQGPHNNWGGRLLVPSANYCEVFKFGQSASQQFGRVGPQMLLLSVHTGNLISVLHILSLFCRNDYLSDVCWCLLI